MKTAVERDWKASLVIACDHAGLKPEFKKLEDEVYRVLARVDDPRWVANYLARLRERSTAWLAAYEAGQHKR